MADFDVLMSSKKSLGLGEAGRERLLQLKKSLAWQLASDLIVFHLPPIEPLLFAANDDESSKAAKKQEHEIKMRERDALKMAREPELLQKLEDLVLRVKKVEGEKPKELEYSLSETMTASVYKCSYCGNCNADNFLNDSSMGDVICLGDDREGCGQIVQECKIDTGQQFRNFTGEEDRNHQGAKPNRFMSEAENMKTKLIPSKSSDKVQFYSFFPSKSPSLFIIAKIF